MKPLARNNREWEDASRKVDKLGEPGGYGETLHSRLEEWRNQPERENWLEEFWDDVSLSLIAPRTLLNSVEPGRIPNLS
jgi:hypothetical protein